MFSMRKLVVVGAALGCGLGMQAGIGVAATGESAAEFCKVNLAVDASPEGPTPKLLKKFRDTAPADIKPTVDEAVTTFKDQGDAAFEDPTFTAKIAEIDQYLVDNCGYETVDVSMAEYSFTGIPESLDKGVTAFVLSNDGTELHEFVVARLKGDTTVDDILALPENASAKARKKLVEEIPGGGFAAPGQSDVALINLKKTGNYVALCFVPVGSTPDVEDGGDGPPHAHEGMSAEFTVS
jgi:hypothetical protein